MVVNWQEVSGNWALIPSRPKGIIHFLGGAFVAGAPQITYRWLLEQLAQQGYAVLATPFINTLDHAAIAKEVLWTFEDGLEDLYAPLKLRRGLPIYGLGHSMGCKVHLLIGSLFAVERAGNILVSFNNYAVRQSIPLMEQFTQLVNVEFTPSPLEMERLIQSRYTIRRNLLVQFTRDTIDQTPGLSQILEGRFPGMTTVQKLAGDHMTPMNQDVSWSVGQVFTPLDAIAQWIRQEVCRDLYALNQEILLLAQPFRNSIK
ncbi:MAG: DUF1350 family protein [Oscillatoriales cyanobacterium RM1_1_9]|nr:DUF1350 family protein [Oscillatoriales cyanobacterium RM1_1_9]